MFTLEQSQHFIFTPIITLLPQDIYIVHALPLDAALYMYERADTQPISTPYLYKWTVLESGRWSLDMEHPVRSLSLYLQRFRPFRCMYHYIRFGYMNELDNLYEYVRARCLDCKQGTD